MIPGRRRIGRQQGDEILRIAGLAHAVVHDRGQQHHPVQGHAPVFQLEGHGAGPQGAVGLADNVFRARPTAELGRVAHDGAGEGVGVLVHAPEGRTGRFAQRPREARAHHVDEDQIRLVQQGHVVGAEGEGRRAHHRRLVGLDPHRSERAHVQPHRRRARPAVVQIGHRPRPDRLTVQRIGGVEQAGGRHARVVADRQRARRRVIAQGLAMGVDRMGRRDLGLLDRRARPVFLDGLGVGVAESVARRAHRAAAVAARTALLGEGRYGRAQHRGHGRKADQSLHAIIPCTRRPLRPLVERAALYSNVRTRRTTRADRV